MAPNVFLATYFVGNGESGVYLAASEDGYGFEPIVKPARPVMKPPPGTLTRDPCLILGLDGAWHMVWTTGWWSTAIGVGHSKDLLNWSQQSVAVMAEFPGTINAWAPEIVHDGARYVICWSSTVPGLYGETARADGDLNPDRVPLNHRFYYTTTRDFAAYAPSALLWNPSFNCIDATLVREGDSWLMFGKDETKAPTPHKFLFVAQAPTATGPFHMVSPRITGAYWAEGPTVAKVGDTYRVLFDRYADGNWGGVESEDLHRWRDVSARVRMPAGARHGTVLSVPRAVLEKLRSDLLEARL